MDGSGQPLLAQAEGGRRGGQVEPDAVREGDAGAGHRDDPVVLAAGAGAFGAPVGTLQGRLPKELAAEGVRDMETANQYLEQVFWPSWNQRFAVPGAQSGDGFVAALDADLDDILCLEERKVGNDNCVR